MPSGPHDHTTTRPHDHTTTRPHDHTTTRPHNHTTARVHDHQMKLTTGRHTHTSALPRPRLGLPNDGRSPWGTHLEPIFEFLLEPILELPSWNPSSSFTWNPPIEQDGKAKYIYIYIYIHTCTWRRNRSKSLEEDVTFVSKQRYASRDSLSLATVSSENVP